VKLTIKLLIFPTRLALALRVSPSLSSELLSGASLTRIRRAAKKTGGKKTTHQFDASPRTEGRKMEIDRLTVLEK